MGIKKRPPLPAGGIAGLDADVLDLLVSGPSAGDEFFEFTFSIEQLRELVREHGAALEAEARRRGLRAPWGAQFERGGDP